MSRERTINGAFYQVKIYEKSIGFYVVITWLEDGLGKVLSDCDVLFFFKKYWFMRLNWTCLTLSTKCLIQTET